MSQRHLLAAVVKKTFEGTEPGFLPDDLHLAGNVKALDTLGSNDGIDMLPPYLETKLKMMMMCNFMQTV